MSIRSLRMLLVLLFLLAPLQAAEPTADRLRPPTGPIEMVLDSDMFNEVDDQFALAFAVRSPERIDLKAVCAAPFLNHRSKSAGDGMEKSYDETLRVLKVLGEETGGRVFRGSGRFLADRNTPVDSPAARHLIRLAHQDREGPLYVVGLGAATNLASALLLDPTIADRIVIVWIGGHPHSWPQARDFNLKQDIAAAQVLFDSGVPLVHVPAGDVAASLKITLPELEAGLKGKSPIADALYQNVDGYYNETAAGKKLPRSGPNAWQKVIWDIATIAWLLEPEKMVTSQVVPSPVLTDEGTWKFGEGRHSIRVAVRLDRRRIFSDLFRRIGNRPLKAADDTAFPGSAWEQATPESQGVDSTKLTSAVEFLREAAGREGVKRMVIVRNGRIIWRGTESGKAQGVWSVTKAFTSTAQGLLIEDGKCTLDTLAKDFDPDLAKYYPTVTLRHFATMTSGLDGVGGGYDFDDQRRGDQNALVEPLPPFFPPGTKYMYWDEATQHYGYTLTQIAGESLHDYLKRRILDPIGITQLTWKLDETGKVLNWTGGIEISAEDLARFGLLYLNRGNWNGRQLIDSDWVEQATRVQVPPSIPNALPTSSRKGSGVYGYHWWPNGITPEGKRRWPDAPRSTYSRSGYNNNDLFVIPAWNMVTVRLGLDQREDAITASEYSTFLRMVGEAIRGKEG